MEDILDFSHELNIELMDRVVMTFFTGSGVEQRKAQEVLTQFQEHPDSWQRVDGILERSQFPQTKFLALQILEKVIRTRWKVLPREHADGIRNFIVGIIITSSMDEKVRREHSYLGKLNMVLVQILKQEWPHNWPNFIPELVSSSRSNLDLCENNMAILKLLSEEIFDFSEGEMTQQKTRNLKTQMCGEFSEVFQLCDEVLHKAQKPSLIKATLETLLRFLNWVPLGYIFETDMLDLLCNKFLKPDQFRNVTFKCLTEIASLHGTPEYDGKLATMFNTVVACVNELIPASTNIAEAYEDADEDNQAFIQNLAMFLTTVLGRHLTMLEEQPNKQILLNAHYYLVKISQVEEREVFKVCLEYWSKLVAELYAEVQQMPISDSVLNLSGSFSSVGSMGHTGVLRKNVYAEILSQLRVVMIERMVKPEEVLIVENDEGEIVREFVKESDTLALYKSMRECLVYLTHLDTINMESIMLDKLAHQMDGSEWSWNNLNKLCWAVGSISGAMTEEVEKRFLVNVIKDLLNLCENKRGKDNKAVVASNIMYVVGQYPRFLKAHWKFLKTVVNKLFEFMHELHEGVQDMACDTFIKISQKCRRHFVLQQIGEVRPFVEDIVHNIEQITGDLSPQQIHTFYEAVGYMINAQTNPSIQCKLVEGLMRLPNTAWRTILGRAGSDISVLGELEQVKVLGNVLKTNKAVCDAVGHGYLSQLNTIYGDMLILYKAVSGFISDAVVAQGLIAARTPRVRAMRAVKKETLRIIESFVQRTNDLDNVVTQLLPSLLDAVLIDYGRSVEPARDAEVLITMAAIAERLGHRLTDQVPGILDAVFECTLSMINKDFSEYPEHRVGFFALISAINKHCFDTLIKLPTQQFKLILDSVVWAFKHTMRDIGDTGLNICLDLLNNIARADEAAASAFYQNFFLNLLQDVFFVLTDREHKSGFKMQCRVLARMFELVESGAVVAPLFDRSQVSDPNMTNQQFLRDYVMNLLQNAFQHLQPAQIRVFVLGLFNLNRDPLQFKLHVRDFLVQLKEFSGDTADLYLEEREAELLAKQNAEKEKALMVPGLVKPSEMPTMDED
ncbi:Crm1-F1 [Thamnocephalis sphaerospora]|uniref:Crm1-F1 n=1 Tax=Thamnocephalis sphaerospora TaxID=78915 RepID=A0A4P9XQ96_9FUNG|nr:Crm1-F1 [Thamnocephalis sphaerospora]|eukprot:RKP08205.1 Crm1-F1 [Thamnocephalis sphaerospora]